MFESRQARRRIGRFAWVMAWVGLVLGQLHALARFSVPEHAEDLEYPLTAAWAVPAMDALRPLLDWGDPDLVYVTYGKIWLPVFVAYTLCAFVVRRGREPATFEKWAWRVALTGYSLECLAVLLDYWTQWTGDYNRLFAVGWFVTVPALLLATLGSTLLGLALLLARFRPVLPALLLLANLPLALGIVQVTSLGSSALPVMFAFGILGRRLGREADLVPLPDGSPPPASVSPGPATGR